MLHRIELPAERIDNEAKFEKTTRYLHTIPASSQSENFASKKHRHSGGSHFGEIL